MTSADADVSIAEMEDRAAQLEARCAQLELRIAAARSVAASNSSYRVVERILDALDDKDERRNSATRGEKVENE